MTKFIFIRKLYHNLIPKYLSVKTVYLSKKKKKFQESLQNLFDIEHFIDIHNYINKIESKN